MEHTITQVQIVPIRPKDGLIGFANLVLDEGLFLGCIGIYTKRGGGYRLTYPRRQISEEKQIVFDFFKPISREMSQAIEEAVIPRVYDIFGFHLSDHLSFKSYKD